jgi:hypothetical protein
MDHYVQHFPCETRAVESDLVLARELGAPADASPRELQLYARYVRALAVLGECAPYVDEPDLEEQIDSVLSDASARHPLHWLRG